MLNAITFLNNETGFDLTHATPKQASVLGKLNDPTFQITSEFVEELDSFFYKGQCVEYIVNDEIFTGDVASIMVLRSSDVVRIIRKDDNGVPTAIDRVKGEDVQALHDFTSEIGEAVRTNEQAKAFRGWAPTFR